MTTDEFLGTLSTPTLRKVSKALNSDFTIMKIWGQDSKAFEELTWVMWRVSKIISERV